MKTCQTGIAGFLGERGIDNDTGVGKRDSIGINRQDGGVPPIAGHHRRGRKVEFRNSLHFKSLREVSGEARGKALLTSVMSRS